MSSKAKSISWDSPFNERAEIILDASAFFAHIWHTKVYKRMPWFMTLKENWKPWRVEQQFIIQFSSTFEVILSLREQKQSGWLLFCEELSCPQRIQLRESSPTLFHLFPSSALSFITYKYHGLKTLQRQSQSQKIIFLSSSQ